MNLAQVFYFYINLPLTSSPFQNKFLDILCAAKDLPRQGLPTIVTTKGALIQHGDAVGTVVGPLLIFLSENEPFAKSKVQFFNKYFNYYEHFFKDFIYDVIKIN